MSSFGFAQLPFGFGFAQLPFGFGFAQPTGALVLLGYTVP
jgi:hypothetical protein